MTNDEILDFLNSPKVESPEQTNQLSDKPKIRKKYEGKKLDREKFTYALDSYLDGRGITQAEAAEMVDVSTPTFLKYANMLYTEGRLDGKHFTDGIGIVLTQTKGSGISNEKILYDISR